LLYGLLFDQPGPFYNLDIFVRWEVAPPSGYIYAAFCSGFEAGSGGYMGLQIVGSNKKVLFSIWDIEEGAEATIPMSANARRFSGEGTGTQCPLDYDWEPNREYRLRLWTLGSDDNGENWIATMYDTITGIETTIGIIYLKNSRGYRGMDGSRMKRAYPSSILVALIHAQAILTQELHGEAPMPMLVSTQPLSQGSPFTQIA
jgi:hypothetical protein